MRSRSPRSRVKAGAVLSCRIPQLATGMWQRFETVVEVAGVEPASSRFSTGLLRAQPMGVLERPSVIGTRRSLQPEFDVPSRPQANCDGEPFEMAPRFRPNGWAGWDARSDQKIRPRVRGCPRQLLLGTGSFTTIRRRRLASPASNPEIEATHPLVNAPTGGVRDVRSSSPTRVPHCRDRTARGRSSLAAGRSVRAVEGALLLDEGALEVPDAGEAVERAADDLARPLEGVRARLPVVGTADCFADAGK